MPNNGMQRTALRAAADAERLALEGMSATSEFPLAGSQYLADFLVKQPLYVKQRVNFPDRSTQMVVRRADLRCPSCRAERPFTVQRRVARGSQSLLADPKSQRGCRLVPASAGVCCV
jgi:hypothetical protein